MRGNGPRRRALGAALRRRERVAPAQRAALDARTTAALARPLAIVYTDTADFTERVARHGMLHFMMVFERAVRALRPLVRRHAGRLVKLEADSLLLAFPDPERACRAVEAISQAIGRLNRGRPRSERVAFSYGIGFGDVLVLDQDLLGLEVNLASKLGEDCARPGEILLTPGAVSALPPKLRLRLAPHGEVRYTRCPMPVARLCTARPRARRPRKR